MAALSESVDTHVHLASSRLPNAWADGDLNADCARAHPNRAVAVARAAGDLTEARLAEDIAAAAAADLAAGAAAPSPHPVRITRAIFIECFNWITCIDGRRLVLTPFTYSVHGRRSLQGGRPLTTTQS